LPAFIPAGRDDPGAGLHVDLIPAGAEGLAGPGGGQDHEPERAGGGAGLLLQGSHEGRHLGVGQGGMVRDRGDLRARRQQPL
jgi:hypothetical protein